MHNQISTLVQQLPPDGTNIVMDTSSDKNALFVRKYDKDLYKALDFGEAGHYDKAHKAAQYNLTDPKLPRWH